MESALKPQGVFWLFSGISVFGAIFCYVYIKETKGLNDKDKKMLYSPIREHRQSLVILDNTGEFE